MNHYTTIEQSKHLIELGLKAESADMHYGNFCLKGLGYCSQYRAGLTPYIREVEIYEEIKKEYHIDKYDGIVAWEVLPCWSVGALLELMPEFVLDGDGQYYLKILKSYYHGIGIRYGNDFRIKASFVGENAFYKMICWLLQNNYIKTE